MEAMRSLKRAADPNNLLNPGKIIAAPKMDSNLRYGAEYQAQVWNSGLSFARQGGLDIAVEQCNGQGVCRRLGEGAGVMCPSFQATREEMHSTRGRANLLRALITNYELRNTDAATHNDQLTDSVAQALDLCLACKGCKAECPSGVDMAKLKYGFQAEYYKTHRRQLRDYVFGYFHLVAAVASSIAPLSNALMEIPAFKNLAAHILGITTKRPFPRFAGRRSKILATEPRSHGEKIVFLADVFSHFVEPEVEQAAFDTLAKCGYDVQVLPVMGAGALFLSKAFIEEARRHAGKVLDALNQADPAREAPVVGLEPPEIYAMKHEYMDLLPDRHEEILQRTEKVWLLDEFLIRSDAFHRLRVGTLEEADRNANRISKSSEEIAHLHRAQVPVSPPARNDVKFHPHCHQRAEGLSSDGLPTGTNATLELLRACGYNVELIDSGCCGMAGTFGYEAEHYDLSMKVGELKLFPYLRQSHIADRASLSAYQQPRTENRKSEIVNRKSTTASSGSACRMQIRQGTGIDAVHPILLVQKSLVGPPVAVGNRDPSEADQR
jgi:Fe-S oxidoreductase